MKVKVKEFDVYKRKMIENTKAFFLTVAPEVLSPAPARDVASAVDGRLALFERLGATVVDALVAVDGLEARRREK
jgi:hypothetical protein